MSAYTSFHGVRRIEAFSGNGSLSIELRDDHGRISDVTIHIENRDLARQLAAAINGVMEPRGCKTRAADAGANAA